MADDVTTVDDSVVHTYEYEGQWTDPNTEESVKTRVVKTYIVWDNYVCLHSKDGQPAVHVELVEGENAGLVVEQEWWYNNFLHRESGPARINGEHSEYFYKGVGDFHMRLLASAKGIDADSWADLVKFAKSEQI